MNRDTPSTWSTNRLGASEHCIIHRIVTPDFLNTPTLGAGAFSNSIGTNLAAFPVGPGIEDPFWQGCFTFYQRSLCLKALTW